MTGVEVAVLGVSALTDTVRRWHRRRRTPVAAELELQRRLAEHEIGRIKREAISALLEAERRAHTASSEVIDAEAIEVYEP